MTYDPMANDGKILKKDTFSDIQSISNPTEGSYSVSTTLTESAMALVSATAADVVLTLPAAADVADEAPMVKKVLGAHKVIIAAQGTDEIDGVASIEITTPMAAFSLFSDGTTWHVL